MDVFYENDLVGAIIRLIVSDGVVSNAEEKKFFAIDGEIYNFDGLSVLAVVLTHTCPQKYIPYDEIGMSNVYGEVDTSTEEWLGTLESNICYKHWFCGHFHIDKDVDKISFSHDRVLKIDEYLEQVDSLMGLNISSMKKKFQQ